MAENQFILLNECGPANIPKMKFLEDIPNLVQKHPISKTLPVLYEYLSKYKYMEEFLSGSRRVLEDKLPNIESALESVNFLIKKLNSNDNTTFKTQFTVSENLSATAIISKTESVMLWLGATTLLEFPIFEAQELLEANRVSAISSIEELENALNFLRCQITTAEVNIARIHNYGVVSQNLQK